MLENNNNISNKTIKIAIDAMGGDFGVKETVEGAVRYFETFTNTEDVCVILVGMEDAIKAELSKYKYDASKIIIENATELITSSEKPMQAIRNKKDSSMVKAMKLVKNKEADAVISAGNTGALLTGATMIIGRIKGIERPALATLIPYGKGYSLLLDVGANSESKPNYLLQFAKMGSLYMENVMNVENPKVGLVNIGTEPEKGTQLYLDSYELLSNSGLNFTGNMEGRDISTGLCDVMVCDGFVGNIVLKNCEGLSKTLMTLIKEAMMSTMLTKIGAFLAKDAFKSLKKLFDYTEVGGAPLIGLKSLVVKAHGNSDAKTFASAINQCTVFSRKNVIEHLEKEIEKA